MLEEGLIPEIEDLLARGYLRPETTAAQAIGYKELIGALKGEKTLETATDELKQYSRNYAKRQLTWFRNTADKISVYVDTEDGAMRPYSDVLGECIKIFSSHLKT